MFLTSSRRELSGGPVAFFFSGQGGEHGDMGTSNSSIMSGTCPKRSTYYAEYSERDAALNCLEMELVHECADFGRWPGERDRPHDV